MRIPAVVSQAASAAGDLLLGASCPGCGQPGLGLCRSCGAALAARTPRPTAPTPTPAGFPRCVTTGPYDHRLAGLIHAVKDESALLVTPVLADLLARAVVAALSEAPDPTPNPVGAHLVMLVPVPSTPAAVRRRGYDATWAMTRAAARRVRAAGCPVVARRLLRHRRRVADQSALDTTERARNLTGALDARPARRVGDDQGAPAPVLLVDDLVTTGASLTEAARALAVAGWQVRGAAVVAATQRRSPPTDLNLESVKSL